MKILFVIRSLQHAGAERQLVTLAVALQARGHNCAVATFYSGGGLEAELMAGGARLLSLHKKGRWDTVAFQRRLLQTIRNEAPDVIHTYLSGPNLLVTQLKPWLGGVPVVWGVLASKMDMRMYDWLQQAAYRVEPLAAHAAALIICNSHKGRADAISMGYPADCTVTVDNGINAKRFAPNAAAREELRAHLGILPDTPLVAIVGRMDPVKDHETFLHAATLVRLVLPECRFLIIGGGSEDRRDSLIALAEELGIAGALRWEAARSDLESVYPAIDVLVSSSTSEGSSNVIAEAMACGVPCAVTNVGDSARIVGDSGATAPRSDPTALARAILDVVARRSAELSKMARDRILQNYTIEQMVENTEVALASVVA